MSLGNKVTKKKPPKPITIQQIKPDPQNLRLHPESNKAAIRASLVETGPFRSIAVDRDGIVRAGNGVYEQAQKLGYKIRLVDAGPGELIAVRRPDLYGRAAARAALADNHTTDLSQWDLEALTALAQADQKMLEGIFSAEEVAGFVQLIKRADGITPPVPLDFDQAEVYERKWETAIGQHWRLPSISVPGGYHDLYIDDCLKAPLHNEHIGIFTSPPYAEQRATKYGGIAPERYKQWWGPIQKRLGAFLGHHGVFLLNLKAHAEGGVRVTYVMELVLAMVKEWGWKYVDEFCWVKPGYPGDMGKRFKNAFEPIYLFTQDLDYKFRLENVVDYRQSNFGGYVENLGTIQGQAGTDNTHALSQVRPSNVLHLMPDSTTNEAAGGHPARFPPALPEFFIRAYSDAGDRWLDPFAGSGTVAMVCEQQARLSTLIEIQPKYGATILERYAQTFGVIPIPGPRAKRKHG